MLRRHGFGAEAEKPDALSMSRFFSLDLTEVLLVCVCYVDRPSSAKIQYAVRRLSRKNSSARLLLALLGTENTTPVENLAGAQMAQGSFGVVLEALIQATSDRYGDAVIETEGMQATS
jgi:hypothetical protein